MFMKLKKLLTKLSLAAVLVSTLNLLPSTASAQGTQFTYQGRLDSGGSPVNGANDLTFTLYNAATLGATVGTSNVFNDLLISNGLFTVTLDFGAGAFNGSARWLQIAARPGPSTGAYTNLAPRQPVTPTPYAMFAGGASAAGVSGTLSAAQIPTLDAATKLTGTVPDARLSANVALLNAVNRFTAASNTFSGRVGIGTTTPGGKLEIAGDHTASPQLNLKQTSPGWFTEPFFNAFRYIRTEFAGPANDGPFRQFNVGGGGVSIGYTNVPTYGSADALYVNGNVGIGRNDPGAKLDVNGNIVAVGGITVNNAGSGSMNISDTANDAGNSWFLFNGYYGAGNFAIARYDPALGGFPSDRNIFINAAGKVGIGTVSPGTKLDVAGEITCVAVNLTSDRNAKEDFKPVSGREVLAKVAALPITEWQYKTQGDSRHIGPMAQDFHAAFGTGRDDKHIASVDADGVALAAIQGLNEKLDEKSAEVEALKQSVAELKELVKQLTQPAGR